jgi:endonuclease YncB( thermonuclease family)
MTCTLALCLIGDIAIDGDSLKLDGKSYRVFGIDAPERGEAGFGPATAALQSLADRGLTCDVIDVDRYGRTVIRCDAPGTGDIACALVNQGHATDWPRYSGGRYAGCG